ncbi:splicing regulatory glutamine/lysine-rich protein 1-like isoform X2 [Telopea speciosissima]|uniref:splicing regulatory glutamine/lysine-rich protein 1-like isoform X2 n=1 Tax=Telopea speciosissima TaxID=54955 RepID=UPI001CC3CEFC|nr:splicing regulatory glutamine/lysine-rich protein 1-like isoform X2 [Telopea speciosissima]
MSRCFPYPPPGYERKSGALDEALINSIKKEREKGKKERKKEKKREKKEKKGREREKGGVEEKLQKHVKRLKNERSKVEHKGGDHPRKEEAEQFERSGLTEEHGHPVAAQNLYDSSDSTQNSHKRKKHCSPSSSSHNLGSILRIRLKQKDQKILPSNKLPGSNSGKTGYISQGKYEIPPRLCQEQLHSSSGRQQQCSTSGRAFVAEQQSLKQDNQETLPSKELTRSNLLNAGPILQGKIGISPRYSEVQTCSTLERATVVMQGKCENDPKPIEGQTCSTSGLLGVQGLDITESARRSSSKLKKRESRYRDLIENWVPPIIENSLSDFDDEEWFFKTQSKSERVAKRYKPSNDEGCLGSSDLWPRACYLPGADVYVLPYTVPF